MARSSRFFRMIRVFSLAFLICGCGLAPQKVSLSSPEIKPLLAAIEKVDRATLGFTPISTNAAIRLELSSRANYDAMLHVYGDTSRTIGFRKEGDGYRWISEQEIHTGPKWQQTIDGNFRERIVVEYQTERVNGIPLNELQIVYSGDDPEIKSIEKLTLVDAQGIFARWKNAAVEPKPPLVSGDDFDPGLLMFALILLLMFLVACCLALFLAAICVCIGMGMLAVGIISTAVLTGVLQRSVSSAFRTLFLLVGAVSGLVLGIIFSSMAGLFFHLSWQNPARTIVSALVGLISGLLFAWVFNRAWTQVAQWLSKKLKSKSSPVSTEAN
jgi:hypothetical protein